MKSSQHRPARSERAPDASSAKIAELEAELAENKDRLLRALAEQENARKTARRERDDAVRFAAGALAEDLLPTADNLDRAIANVPPERLTDETIARFLTGIVATQRGLLEAFNRHGIRRVDPAGEPFDPNQHHAIYEQIDPTAPEGTVVEVMQPGYLYHDRLLRPAKVVVAKGASANSPGKGDAGQGS